MQKINKKSKLGSEKSFGVIFFVVFLIFGTWPLIYDENIRVWSLITSFIFLLTAITKPKILKPLNHLWIKFGDLLGIIISPIVMGVVFFFVVTPIGLLMRLLGKDLLNIKFLKKNSYWIQRNKKIGSMKRQF